MAGRVYSYIRFSDARQATGASTERQKAYAEKWAADHGLVLDAELSMRDEGLSAYHQKHVKQGALGVFLRAVEDGLVEPGSVLIVEGLDRLSRAEPIQAQGQLAGIVNAGITVVTPGDGKVYSRESLRKNPMDLIHSLIVMIRAHEESETKSKRVRDAIRRQCQGWIDGTYRGLIRYGKTPGWLQVVDGKWQLIPERAEAMKAAAAMFLRGLGTGAIAKRLYEAGMAVSDAVPTSTHMVRVFGNPALVGDKVMTLDGIEYVLRDYYPAVIDRDTQDEIKRQVEQRTKRQVKGDIPSLFTGMGLAFCGYCGAPVKAQNLTNTRRADGTITDGNRRVSCINVNRGSGCAVAGSCSVVPIERAITSFCSDMVNLRSLQAGDLTAGPRAELASAQAKQADVERKLERLTAALLESEGAVPATFARRATELEAEQTDLKRQIESLERALAAAARADITGADEAWQAISKGVHALEFDARMQARQLIADTFERIVVYHHSVEPEATPPGLIDVHLIAKGGTGRMLRIDKKGNWVSAEDQDPAGAHAEATDHTARPWRFPRAG